MEQEMKSLLQLFLNLIDDVMRLHPDVVGLGRDYLTIKARLEDEGSGFASVTLPSFGKTFDLSLASGRMAHVPGFARNKSLPKFLQGLTSLVFDAKSGLLRDDYSVEAIVSIRQICYLCKKMLPGVQRDELLRKLAIKQFLADDDSIKGIAPFRLDRLNRVGQFILGDLDDFQELDCRHGPGAVAEGYTHNQKWESVYRGLVDMDPRLIDYGYDLPAMLLRDRDIIDESSSVHRLAASARLAVVAKSCSAMRTITVEPCLNQFVQQGFNTWLRDCVSRCPVLKQSLTLDSQVPNQQLALEGSITGNWCTIDLSAASDLLSLQAVEAVFASKPRFLSGIKACRTSSVEVGSDTIHLNKYAGMGNATTFPIQSVVFTVIALSAMVGSTKELNYEKLRRFSKCIRVFGDDIVVRSEYYQDVADWIICCGLKINRSKTFSEGNFRESCGVDAIGGTDVTPVYLRHDPDSPSTDSVLTSFCDTSNQLWFRGYYRTAGFIQQLVEKVLGPLPLVANNSSGLGWKTRKNWSTASRWSHSLHRFEVRTYVPSSSRKIDNLSGFPALIKFYHTPRLAEYDVNHLSSSVRRFTLNLRKRWVPV